MKCIIILAVSFPVLLIVNSILSLIVLPIHNLMEDSDDKSKESFFDSSLYYYSTLYLNFADLYIALLLVSLYYYLCYFSVKQKKANQERLANKYLDVSEELIEEDMMNKHINGTLIELEKSHKKQQGKKEVRDTKDIKDLLLNKDKPSLEDNERERFVSLELAP